jgi:hypothetical protein
MLRGLAIAANAGVLLTLATRASPAYQVAPGLSGSTAWNASVRSRLYFKRAVTAKDEEPDADLRVLEVMKSNYGPVGETINAALEGRVVLTRRRTGQPRKIGARAKGR